MLMFPVPVFVALVIGYLALRTFLAGGRPLLLALLCLCAAQSLMVALVVFYSVEVLRPALPVTATLVPPLAWVTFRDALLAHQRIRDDWLHLSAPAFTLFCTIFAPLTLDIVVPGIFLAYGVSLLLFIRRAPAMPLARLEAGDYPALIWKALAWALIGSAASDVLIALTYLSGRADWALVLISVSSSLALLFVGLLSVSPDASGPSDDPVESPQDPAPDKHAAEYPAIVGKLNALLEQQGAHLDPDLTLSRLGRRLHVPEKRLSAAVNRVTGENVSRYVNRWRIRHASKLIATGTPITEAMLSSGFNTKSNFNREFQRVTGVSPSQWRDHEETRVVLNLSENLPALPRPKRARQTS
ncbi:MAG: AraC family transcriptional regulator [Hoeflea sp.]|uniref:helix-turn-helix domain-containing protein n=1 Tax=Hoeflea sp. TaxID=1940281 RepID=UPI0032EC96B4